MECKPGAAIFTISLSLAIAHQFLPGRSLYTHLNFYSSYPGDTYRSPGMEASRVYGCSPTGLHIFVYFKDCCLRVWVPIRN